jgi:hypothetical protein
VREVVPAVAREHLRRGRVAEDAGLVLGEDAVARERAQQTVQRVRVGTRLLRQLGHPPRAVGERLRDAQVGDDREGARDEPSSERIPHRPLGRTRLRHRHSVNRGGPARHSR